MNFINYKKFTNIFLFILILVATFVGGSYFGYSRRPEIEKAISITNKESQVVTTADFAPYWKVWNLLNEKSIYATKVSDQDRVWGTISGLASSLKDPYTIFFSPEENKLFNDTIHGSFSGIGAEIGMKDKILTIIAPLRDTPAWNAGIKAGDKIIKIDKTDTADMTVDKAISLIRGEKGTTVTLTIFRAGEQTTREFKIIRDTVELPTIDTEFIKTVEPGTKKTESIQSQNTGLIKGDIFLIKFYSFSENSAELFRQALIKFADSEAHKMIIDLRGNPGGYLESAVNIGSWFIDEGKPIIREDFGDKKKEEVYRSHGPRLFTDQLQLVVLVDGGSASASEILAGALKENKIGTLVGETTFGKGSVQELVQVTEDTSLKITVAKWLTPNGVSISDKGLEPDIKVSITQKDIDAKRDSQMDKAIEILSAKP